MRRAPKGKDREGEEDKHCKKVPNLMKSIHRSKMLNKPQAQDTPVPVRKRRKIFEILK